MTQATHEARLNFRLAAPHKVLIERAARSLGQSVSEFAVACLVRDARVALQDEAATELTLRDRDVFLKLLDSEAQPNAALRRAARRYKARRA